MKKYSKLSSTSLASIHGGTTIFYKLLSIINPGIKFWF